MPASYMKTTGGVITGGVRQPFLSFQFSLPDAFGGNVSFAGNLGPVGGDGGSLQAKIPFSGSPIAMPAVPAGGQTTLWGLQVNTSTAVVSLKSNTGATGNVANPTADAGNVMLFIHNITNGDTIPYIRTPTNFVDLSA